MLDSTKLTKIIYKNTVYVMGAQESGGGGEGGGAGRAVDIKVFLVSPGVSSMVGCAVKSSVF